MDALLDPHTASYTGSRTSTLANAVYLRLATPLGSLGWLAMHLTMPDWNCWPRHPACNRQVNWWKCAVAWRKKATPNCWHGCWI